MVQRKKIIILCSVIFLCLFLGRNYIYDMYVTNIMSVGMLSRENIEGKEKIIKNPTEIGMLYNDSPVVFDEMTNTIYIPQNIYDKTWNGKIKTSKGKLGFEENSFSKDKEEVIKEGHVFKLFWFDEKKYCEYNLIFSGMPIVSLQTQEILDESQEVWAGTIEVYDVYRTSQFYQKYDCVYNIRGASVRKFPKKSYKVELKDTKVSFLGMRSDDDWILNALYDDAGLVHNKVSMDVWKDISKYNSVKGDEGYDTEYVEVFLDGQYNGVYLLGERVDEKQLELKGNDILYKCRAMRIPEEHNYTNEETDDMPPIFLLKYPNEDISKNWEPIKKWVNCFLKFEVTDYETASQILNMENAIDYNLYCLLIGGGDNTRKNVFFSRNVTL